jgi:hypothetical protein
MQLEVMLIGCSWREVWGRLPGAEGTVREQTIHFFCSSQASTLAHTTSVQLIIDNWVISNTFSTSFYSILTFNRPFESSSTTMKMYV